MAKTQKYEQVRVLDENGQTEYTLRYPEGSSMYNQIKDAREGGGSFQVFKPNEEGEELYTSTTNASAQTSIDPKAGTITVKGPKWLVNDIVNSDSFKENFTNNKSLLSFVNQYRMNPLSSVQNPSTGETTPIASVIQQFQDSANSYANSYAEIADYKDDINKKFGVNFTDKNAAVATNYIDKQDYKSNSVVYVPEWAIDKADWRSVGSWDEDNRTVSAKDFFNELFTEGFDDKTTSTLQKDTLDKLTEMLSNNIFSSEETEEEAARKNKMATADYADELARTEQLYKIVNTNKPEVSAMYNAAMFGASAVQNFVGHMGKFGLNVVSTATGLLEAIPRLTSDLLPEDMREDWLLVNDLAVSPVLMPTIALGEAIHFVQLGGDYKQAVLDFEDDIKLAAQGKLHEAYGEYAKEMDVFFEDLNARMAKVSGGWAIGELFGELAGYAVEQRIFYNAIGEDIVAGIIGRTNKTGQIIGGIPAIVRVLQKTNGKGFAATAFKLMASGASVLAQTGLEIMIMDKDLVRDAFETGELSGELQSRIRESFIWNLIGEASAVGASWWLENTTPGKFTSNIITSVSSKMNALKEKGYYKLFKFLNNGDFSTYVERTGVTTEAIGRAATKTFIYDGVEISRPKAIQMLNTSAHLARSEAYSVIAKLPVTGELSKEQQQALDYAWQVLTGNQFNPSKDAKTLEEINAVIKETNGALTDESIQKVKSLSDRINKNFENRKKMLTAIAEFENQLDAISRGVSIKMSEIQSYAGENYSEYVESQNNVAKLQGKNLKLTRTEGLLSQEVTDYLSYSSQSYAYASKIRAVESATDKTAEIKRIFGKRGADGQIISNGQKEYEKAAEYLAGMQTRLSELRGIMGAELTKAADDLLPKMASYTKSIDDYMIAHGFYDAKTANQIARWREESWWGEGGKYFIHTNRLFSNETMQDALNGLAERLANPSAYKVKTIMEDPKFLKAGNLEDHFIDPNDVLQGYLHASAAAAQGQTWGRTLHAMSIATREVSGFTNSFESKYAKQYIGKNIREMQANFSKTAKDGLEKGIREAFESNNIFGEGIDAKRTFSHAKDNIKKSKAGISEAQTQIDEILKTTGAYEQTTWNFGDSDLNNMFAAMPESVNIPTFNVGGMDDSEFKGWLNGLPKETRQTLLRDLRNQGIIPKRARTASKEHVEKLLSGENELLKIKRSYAASEPAIKDTKEYKDFMRAKVAQEIENDAGTILADSKEDYEKAVSKLFKNEELYEKSARAQELGKPTAEDISTFGDEFVLQINNASDKALKTVISSIEKTESYANFIEEIVETTGGILPRESVSRYLALKQLEGLSDKEITAFLMKSSGIKSSFAADMSKRARGRNVSSAYVEEISDAAGKGVKAKLTSMLDNMEGQFVSQDLSSILDIESYWNKVEKEMKEVQKFGLRLDKNGNIRMDSGTSRNNLIQLVDEKGDIRFYETSPLYASLANVQPGFRYDSDNKVSEGIQKMNARLNQIFRWGTTGVDRTSYINQWFRDPMNASVVGFARPFTDLQVGGPFGAAKAFASDSVPFGNVILGKHVTTKFSDEFVNTTFAASEKGLIEEYGQEFVDGLRARAIKGIDARDAEKAYQRAIVEYSAGANGMDRVPGLGGITTAEFYTPEGKKSTLAEMRRKRIEKQYGGSSKNQEKVFSTAFRKTNEKLDSAFDFVIKETSRGNWRESYMRKSVYAGKYRDAIKSGMTAKEAKIWATRYALDATTDFSRTFSFANQLIKNVPYLGAAINGQRSFFRLLALDPVGVTARFTNGIILPYMQILTSCLSDPDNRKAYMEIPEWEKSDAIVLVNRGTAFKIPIPQELSGFIAPFRHMMEKSAGANDRAWTDLILNDALGMFPIDLSGFVELDANTLLSEDEETGIWSRIGRGTEKALSSLMPPAVKGVWMWKTGRDPYTGKEIDRSYIEYDEEGNPVIVDSQISAIAKILQKIDPKLSASAANKIMQSFIGRSTITVLDGTIELLSGTASPDALANKAADEYMSPIEVNAYKTKAHNDWQQAINLAYEKREELINNDSLQKALAILRNSQASEEKKAGALASYNEIVEEYQTFVLGISTKMKEQYPEAFTSNRAAQVINLLTLPTGTAYIGTDAADELQRDEYYQSKNLAIDTYIRMGFPRDTSVNSVLGSSYYDSNGNYQFKQYTPYEIQALNNMQMSTSEQFTAQISQLLKANDLDRGKMWDGYYKATDKASRKAYMQEWNAKVITALYPMMSKYGATTVLNDAATRDLLDNYIFVDNPYKAKEFLYTIFGGNR